MRKSGRSLNLIDAFSLLNSENESILFCCRQQFFSQLLIDNFDDTRHHVDDKKLLITKSSQLHFALSVNSLTQSRNCQEKFSSWWGLLDNWGNGARRLLTVEKEGASTFQAADLAITAADMLAELYC